MEIKKDIVVVLTRKEMEWFMRMIGETSEISRMEQFGFSKEESRDMHNLYFQWSNAIVAQIQDALKKD